MVSLQGKYGRVIELARQAELDSAPEEHEGRLYLIGTVRSYHDMARIWDALRLMPDWDADVLLDLRSADGTASIVTFPAPPPLAAEPLGVAREPCLEPVPFPLASSDGAGGTIGPAAQVLTPSK